MYYINNAHQSAESRAWIKQGIGIRVPKSARTFGQKQKFEDLLILLEKN